MSPTNEVSVCFNQLVAYRQTASGSSLSPVGHRRSQSPPLLLHLVAHEAFDVGSLVSQFVLLPIRMYQTRGPRPTRLRRTPSAAAWSPARTAWNHPEEEA